MKKEEKIGKGEYAILYFKIKIHKSRKPFWVCLIPIHTPDRLLLSAHMVGARPQTMRAEKGGKGVKINRDFPLLCCCGSFPWL